MSLLHRESFPAYGGLDSLIRTGSSFPEGVSTTIDHIGKNKALEHAEYYWHQIRTAACDELQDDAAPLEDPNVWYWSVVHHNAQSSFNCLLEPPHVRTKAQFFVDQFGRFGAKADLRWLAADGVTVLPDGRDWRLQSFQQQRARQFQQYQLMFSEHQVRRFLTDEAFRDRFYRALTWLRIPFFGTDTDAIRRHYLAGHMREGFTLPARASEYWWHARSFVILAYATSRNDMLVNASPESLKSLAIQWHDWYLANVTRLRPHPTEPRWILSQSNPLDADAMDESPLRVPETPFDNWIGDEVMPTSKLLNELWSLTVQDTDCVVQIE